MLRHAMRLLLAALCAIALMAVFAQADAPTTPQTPATSTTGTQTLAKKPRCVVSQATQRRYVQRVYRRNVISKKALRHLVRMRACARSPKAARNMLKVQRRQSAIRQVRLRSLCGTPVCNKNLGRILATKRGWGGVQFTCLDRLWGDRESGWDRHADNPDSDAYGIPQALPGSKMGPGWQDNAMVQISWGLSYIAGRYGTPCGALSHSYARGWY